MTASSTTLAGPALDLSWVRQQFPALSESAEGKTALYFDAPGGTQVTSSVIEAMSDYLVHRNANVHGPFRTSQLTDRTIADAHAAMADLLNCSAEEVVFGANMTSLTFAMSRALGRDLQADDEIITTVLDHDANVAPWRALAEDHGLVLHTVDIHSENCTLNLDDFERKLSPRTKIVAVGIASNAVGTVNPVDRIISMAHAYGALTYLDAVHYAPHGIIDVQQLGCDFLACSAYKFFGPHVGVLYGRREHLERLKPYKVKPASERIPDRWETGTQNHEGLAGVSACIDYLCQLGQKQLEAAAPRRSQLTVAFEAIARHEQLLSTQMIDGISQLRSFNMYGITKPNAGLLRTPTFGLRHANLPPGELARLLGERDIFTWSGNFYASSLTERLGVEPSGGLLRIGMAHYNSSKEVDRLLSELEVIERHGASV